MQELNENGWNRRQPLHPSGLAPLPLPSHSSNGIGDASSPSFSNNISSELSAILGAAISGAKYGVRIRLPHAFVMTLLFRKETPSEKLKIILKATAEHSHNLASFAALYKV